MEEVWKPTGFAGYSVSNLGRIRSEARIVTNKNGNLIPVKARILKPTKRDNGKYTVTVYVHDPVVFQSTVCVHVLVAEAFIPTERPQRKFGMGVRHKDGDFTNNRADNLEWA